MDLLTMLELQIGFSDLEKYISTFMLENREKVPLMTLKELSKATHTSTATISRFCKKLEQKSYREFRINFTKTVSNKQEKRIDFNKPFKKDDTLNEVADNMKLLYDDTLFYTIQNLDFVVLNKIIDLLAAYDKIDAYAMEMNYWSVVCFGSRLIDINKTLVIDPLNYMGQASLSNKNSISLFVTYSGDMPNEVIDMVKKRGGKIIVITSANGVYLQKIADYCLTIYSKEDVVHKISAFSSKISIDFILDIIFCGLFQKNYEINYVTKMEKVNKYSYRAKNDKFLLK